MIPGQTECIDFITKMTRQGKHAKLHQVLLQKYQNDSWRVSQAMLQLKFSTVDVVLQQKSKYST